MIFRDRFQLMMTFPRVVHRLDSVDEAGEIAIIHTIHWAYYIIILSFIDIK